MTNELSQRTQEYIREYNRIDQLRKEGKERSGGPHMHIVKKYKDGSRTEAYQMGVLGLSTEFVGIDYRPDGTISGAGTVTGTEWDESSGSLDHMMIINAKIRKERGEKIDESEEQMANQTCGCERCSGSVETIIDWESHRRKISNGDPNEPLTDEDKREQEESRKQFEKMMNVFKEVNPNIKVQDTKVREYQEDILEYKRQIEAGNPNVDRSPQKIKEADELLKAETTEELFDIFERQAKARGQGV